MSAVSTCPSCGAGLTFDEMKGQNCPYCRSVLQHQARAVEHAALVNQVLAQNLAQNPWLQGQPRVPPGFGAPMPDHAAQTAQHVQQAVKRSLALTLVLVLVPFVVVAILGVGAVVLFLL